MISVIIPARRERFLEQTINDIKSKFKGEFEIIVTLDGADAKRLDGVKYILNKESKGMRTAINQAVAIAKGEYLLKLDGHCMVDEGMDVKLLADHKDKWVQIPRRKRLDAHNWKIEIREDRPDVDYMYLGKGYVGGVNNAKNRREDLKKILLDDAPTFQGSCYFIKRDYFNKLGLLDDVNFAGSGHEAQEICLKVKRDGGKIVRNKKTWYAHARLNRFYTVDRSKSRAYIYELVKQCKEVK